MTSLGKKNFSVTPGRGECAKKDSLQGWRTEAKYAAASTRFCGVLLVNQNCNLLGNSRGAKVRSCGGGTASAWSLHRFKGILELGAQKGQK